MKTKNKQIEEEIKKLDKQRELLDQEIKKKREELTLELSRLKDEISPAKRLLKLIGYVSITYPPDGISVPRNIQAYGEVSNPNLPVWVIVHPIGGRYYVQGEANVDKTDGKWIVAVIIGRKLPAGERDVGWKYEIMAIANPKMKLQGGEILQAWAPAEYKSEIVTVIRDKGLKVSIKAPTKLKELYLERDDPRKEEEEIQRTIDEFRSYFKPFFDVRQPIAIVINGESLLLASEEDFQKFETKLRNFLNM